MCVRGKCAKLKRLDCAKDTDCPPEVPACFKQLCAGQRHTFISCENINLVSVVSSEPTARGRHKLTVPALLVNDVPAIVKQPLELTSQKRSTFVRSAMDELRTHVHLGDRANEFVPIYYGGCLRSDQVLPISIYEFMPLCYADLDRLNAAWCTRALLTSRIFRVLSFFSATKSGHGVLCDIKPEQFCFTSGLMPKLVDLNQIHFVEDKDETVYSGKKCNPDADKETLAARMKLPPGEGSKERLQCFDKCHTSFHRANPSLVMDEELCDATTNRCPGYGFSSTVFVYCHLFVKPLLDLPDLPAGDATRKLLQEAFERCSSTDPAERETTWRFVKRFEELFELKSFQQCSAEHHSALLQQVLHATVNASGITADYRPLRARHLDALEIARADDVSLRNLSFLVSLVGITLLVLVFYARRVRNAVVSRAANDSNSHSHSHSHPHHQRTNSSHSDDNNDDYDYEATRRWRKESQ